MASPANIQLATSGAKRADVGYTLDVLDRFTKRLLPLAEDVGLKIHRAISGGAAVLLEGAQGSLLDIDHGTYPYVTSSSTTSGGAATGVGIAPKELDSVIGVVKAYTTRVGNGPLPTEFDEPLASEIRQLGNEFGATTGRPRRCGWFDGVVVRYAARVNGLTDLAVTKLDVLDTIDRIGLCTGYQADGDVYEEFPGDLSVLDRAIPRYEWYEGWKASTAAARTLADLPKEARRYLDRIEQLVETSITYVSVGHAARSDHRRGGRSPRAPCRRRLAVSADGGQRGRRDRRWGPLRPRRRDLGAACRLQAARAGGGSRRQYDCGVPDLCTVLLDSRKADHRWAAVRDCHGEARSARRARLLSCGCAPLRNPAAPAGASHID